MALTKPAGVFLQIISIPVMLVGCLQGASGMQNGESGTIGWIVFGIGVVLLIAGGKPARKPKD